MVRLTLFSRRAWGRYLLTTSDLPAWQLFGADLKTWVSLACILGLALSKIPAVLYVSQLPRARRLIALLCMYLGGMLLYDLGYPLASPPLLLFMLFLGSFPSGWIFGTLLQCEQKAGLSPMSRMFPGSGGGDRAPPPSRGQLLQAIDASWLDGAAGCLQTLKAATTWRL